MLSVVLTFSNNFYSNYIICGHRFIEMFSSHHCSQRQFEIAFASLFFLQTVGGECLVILGRCTFALRLIDFGLSAIYFARVKER
jgi:hypothetical protein